jgi:dihydrofolate reductase
VRKLIVSNAMSLDGYYEGPGRNVMALFDYRWDYPTDESFDAYNAQRLRAADTLLLGRVSYDGFKSFWPSVADDPHATPLQREISHLNNAIEKVVISDTLTSEETDPWPNSRIIGRADAHQQLAELKGQTGKDILVFGSLNTLERFVGQRSGRRTTLDDGPCCIGRRHAAIRRTASGYPSSHRHTHMG